jgi:ATP-dependent RNA helicase DeaD
MNPPASDIPTFEALGVEPDIQKGLSDLGYTGPLEVQQAAMGPILAGMNVSLRSKTGSGKTAAFGIPLVQNLDPGEKDPQVLVLAPTRELAGQIAEDLTGIGKHRGIRVAAVYGGASITAQIRAVKKGVHVVAGTPGRLLDLVRRKVLKLKTFRAVVLDEADEMLSMGFFEDVSALMDGCKNCEQVVILSASLEADVAALIDRYAKDVVRIDLSADVLSVEGIHNVYYVIGDDQPQHRYLLHVMAVEKPKSAIVFVNTRKDASLVATVMAREGLQAEMISGELPQSERERVMRSIRTGELRFLVATDVAARGIDISGLTHVINYSLPEDPAVFLHRVGRTGRVDTQGTSISLITGRRVHTLGLLERRFGVKFEERRFPPAEEMEKNRTELKLESLIQSAEAAICDGYLGQSQAILEHPQAEQIVAYLLRSHADRVHDEQRAASNRPRKQPQRGGRPGHKKRRPRPGRKKRR